MERSLFRPAEARPRGEDGIADDESRPLTAAGRADARAVAEALQRHQVRLDKLVTSPLLRARQTAEAAREAWAAPAPEVVVCEDLAPGGKRRRVTRFLRELGMESVALFGHNPDLSVFLAWLVGDRRAGLELAKAGVAKVEFDGKVGKGVGKLTWMVTPEWCRAGQWAPYAAPAAEARALQAAASELDG